MARSRTLLTPQLQHDIVSYIRGGGFPAVAAEAAGVPLVEFEEWMTRGERRRAPQRYRELVRAVRQAHAQVRLSCEVEVRQCKPLDWLLHGPGRDDARLPGWGAMIRPHTNRGGDPSLNQAAVQQFLDHLNRLLAPWPDARRAVAEGMAKQ